MNLSFNTDIFIAGVISLLVYLLRGKNNRDLDMSDEEVLGAKAVEITLRPEGPLPDALKVIHEFDQTLAQFLVGSVGLEGQGTVL